LLCFPSALFRFPCGVSQCVCALSILVCEFVTSLLFTYLFLRLSFLPLLRTDGWLCNGRSLGLPIYPSSFRATCRQSRQCARKEAVWRS
jgi:hypothetical protein